MFDEEHLNSDGILAKLFSYVGYLLAYRTTNVNQIALC